MMIPLRRNCREVTRIVLEGQERDFSLRERVILRLHWAACDGCTRFRKQVDLMHGALGRWRSQRDDELG
jgi:hypothetical protein